MYYIGFLSEDLNKMVLFRSDVIPNRVRYSYFGKVIGSYKTEVEARDTLTVLKRTYGYEENPAKSERQRRFMCAELGRLRAGKKRKTKMIERQLQDFCRKNINRVRNNPSRSYHDQKFLQYMRELEKYVIGSRSYIVTLVKAYEHLQSVRDSE